MACYKNTLKLIQNDKLIWKITTLIDTFRSGSLRNLRFRASLIGGVRPCLYSTTSGAASPASLTIIICYRPAVHIVALEMKKNHFFKYANNNNTNVHSTWPTSAVLINTLSSYVLYDSTTQGRSKRDAGKRSFPMTNVPPLPSSATWCFQFTIILRK